MIKKAVIPVAGFGSRFLPVTKVLPKVMLPVVDKPAIHYLVEEAIASGIEEIIIVTGEDQDIITNYFNRSRKLEEHLIKTKKEKLLAEIQRISSMAELSYVLQKEPRGLGDAIYCARGLINKGETFAVMLGDDLVSSKKPCLLQLIEVFEAYNSSVIGVQWVPDTEVSSYGIIDGDEVAEGTIKVRNLIEKPHIGEAPSNIAITGRYVINSEIFNLLKNTPPGKGGEVQLTDGLRELNKVQKLYAYIFKGTRYDIGEKFGYLKANIEYALKRKDLTGALQSYLKDKN